MAEMQKLDRLCDRIIDCTNFYRNSVPLCAAENVISDFCKIPLEGDFQERYIMGSPYSFNIGESFIGSQFLLPFYELINQECKLLFNAHYVDARTLTGMNCLTTLLMALTRIGEKVAILPAAWGGHASVQSVCERLGLVVYDIPYDIKNWDIDYDKTNELILQERIDYILLAPSDIIKPLHVEKIDTHDSILLYDISQIMGLMAGKTIPCPIELSNTVLFGGTHKTLPGPACGLILTNSDSLHERMEKKINPAYLRHTQMHQVLSLLFALYEMDFFGSEYAKMIVATANKLGAAISSKGIDVVKVDSHFSETHQLFIRCSRSEMLQIYSNAIRFGVTLNKKEKALFSGCGIRLGTQEIARYSWSDTATNIISSILAELRQDNPNSELIQTLKHSLPNKTIHYTFSSEIQQAILESLHKE